MHLMQYSLECISATVRVAGDPGWSTLCGQVHSGKGVTFTNTCTYTTERCNCAGSWRPRLEHALWAKELPSQTPVPTQLPVPQPRACAPAGTCMGARLAMAVPDISAGCLCRAARTDQASLSADGMHVGACITMYNASGSARRLAVRWRYDVAPTCVDCGQPDAGLVPCGTSGPAFRALDYGCAICCTQLLSKLC